MKAQRTPASILRRPTRRRKRDMAREAVRQTEARI